MKLDRLISHHLKAAHALFEQRSYSKRENSDDREKNRNQLISKKILIEELKRGWRKVRSDGVFVSCNYLFILII